MGILNKSTIENWILLHLTIEELGFETTVPITETVERILHRLKAACKRRKLLIKLFFTTKILVYDSDYYYLKWLAVTDVKIQVYAKYMFKYSE